MISTKKTNILQVITTGLTILGLSASLISSVYAPNTFAQRIGMEPLGIDKSNPKEKGWFIITAKPGETVKQTLVVSNADTTDIDVQINPKDATTTTDGDFTAVSNELENKEVGSWVKMEKDTYSVPSTKAIQIPFEVTIPSSATPGEYAGAMCATPSTGKSSSPLSTVVRTCNTRIYITVPGDLNLKTEFSNLQFISPKLENVKVELNKRGGASAKNMVIKFDYDNQSDVYTALNGKIKVTQAGQTPFEVRVNRNLSKTKNTIYIDTNKAYVEGENKAEFEYEVAPQNDTNKSGIKIDKATGNLSVSVNLTKGELDEFTKIRDEMSSASQKEYAVAPVAANAQPAPMIQESKEEIKKLEEKKEEEKKSDNTGMIIAGSIGGAVIVALLAAILFLLAKKKKTEDKVVVKETTTTTVEPKK